MLLNEDESFLDDPEPSDLTDWEDDAFAAFTEELDDGEDVSQYVPPADHIERMLNVLGGALSEEEVGAIGLQEAHDELVPNDSSKSIAAAIRPAKLGVIENPELAEAFLQDASRGTAMLDQAIIDFESQDDREQAIASICRELHTLKGAASTVGLEDIGRYLHEVEDLVQSKDKIAPDLFVETLLACAGTVRRQMAELSGAPSGDDHASSNSEKLGRLDPIVDAEDSISVKASQLDRLMDMLTALVMLRNRRESRVDQLRRVNQEVGRCVARLREVERRMAADPDRGRQHTRAKEHSNPLHEVASDLLEIGRNLRECYDPVAEENVAVSNFIRQFRQALVRLLRMPISGLFRRLQRAALDAARVEQKRVRLEIVSLDVGLERSVQERLFDPLMHIVRNAVSHGIELPEERVRLGKDPVGTITLEAKGTPNLLILSVRDDGRGLDYEALRRRGLQQGLLSAQTEPTEQELSQLIFHRGFSTREKTNEVAGRGIGMDVVGDVLNRMRAWAEVDSRPHQGTTITLTIPLRSIIEHTMVVRAGGQLFALPMLAIRKRHSSPSSHHAPRLRLASVLALNAGEDLTKDTHILVESSDPPARSGPDSPCIRLEVDQVLGPEEVVVRPLPLILRHHGLFSGVTLSGNGEIVLVLAPNRITELVSDRDKHLPAATRPAIDQRKILIVDDSLSARRATANLCEKQGWLAVECADGATALQCLKSGRFSGIITDFDMPDMNGLELIEAVRQNETYGLLPITMLSSRSVEEMETAALSVGASRYLQKPITEAKIESILKHLSASTEEKHDE